MMLPFPGAATDTANATLLFSIATALLYLFAIDARESLPRTAVKTLSVALLAILAVLERSPLLLVAALASSALGDAFLSRDGDKAFLAGLASFLMAHLVYIALFYLSSGSFAILTAEPWRAGVVGVMAVFSLVMLTRLLPVVAPDMRLPIVAYVAAILVMGVAALTLGNLFAIAGAVLFIRRHTRRRKVPDGFSVVTSPAGAFRGLGALLCGAASDHAGFSPPGVGCQPAGASSKKAKSKPGATVQPTSVQSPRLRAICHQFAGTTAWGRWPAARFGPSIVVTTGPPSWYIINDRAEPA
jgi:uncharacterized membrane protein YhhN